MKTQLELTNQFTVDLGDQWRALGYSRKDTAVRFLTANFKKSTDYSTVGGKASDGRSGTVYMLTESCAFEMASKTQTKSAKKFKADKLEQLSNPIGIAENLPTELMVQVILERAAKIRAELEQKIAIDAPKVEKFDKLMEVGTLLSMGAAAKTIGIGRNTLFDRLRKDSVFSKTLPYQNFIDRGYFEARTNVKNGVAYTTAYTTTKGLSWLCDKYGAAK